MPARAIPIEGAPAWIDSDFYAIEAESDGDQSEEMVRGPMMQALLEERFKLKAHRETKEIPTYELTVARGGPKLQPAQQGNCVQIVPGKPIPPSGEKPLCGLGGQRSVRNGQNVTWDVRGPDFRVFSHFLDNILDRPMIDKTGIVGIFDFHMEFAPDETTGHLNSPLSPDYPSRKRFDGETYSPQTGPADPVGGLSIFTAIEKQLGLKLESAKGPEEVLVVDHIERPSEN